MKSLILIILSALTSSVGLADSVYESLLQPPFAHENATFRCHVSDGTTFYRVGKESETREIQTRPAEMKMTRLLKKPEITFVENGRRFIVDEAASVTYYSPRQSVFVVETESAALDYASFESVLQGPYTIPPRFSEIEKRETPRQFMGKTWPYKLDQTYHYDLYFQEDFIQTRATQFVAMVEYTFSGYGQSSSWAKLVNCERE